MSDLDLMTRDGATTVEDFTARGYSEELAKAFATLVAKKPVTLVPRHKQARCVLTCDPCGVVVEEDAYCRNCRDYACPECSGTAPTQACCDGKLEIEGAE